MLCIARCDWKPLALSDVGFGEGAEVIDPHRQEVADFEAVLVVGEDGGRELGAGDEDFGHEAEAFTDEDGRGNQGVAGGCPIVGVGPFGHGDGDGAAFEDVIIDIAAFAHEAAFTNLAGKFAWRGGNEQEIWVLPAICGPVP